MEAVKFARVAIIVLLLIGQVFARPVCAEPFSLSSFLSDNPLATEDLSILVVDEDSTIFSLNDFKKLKIASVSKIVTGAASLELLGTSYQFKTTLYHDGYIAGKTLKGSLYLQNGGDPTFASWKLPYFLTALKSSQIQKIEGNLVIDDSRFLDVRTAQWQSQVQTLNPQMYPLFVNLDPPAGKKMSSYSWKKLRKKSRRFSDLLGKFVIYQNMSEPDLWTGYDFERLLELNKIKFSGRVIRGTVPATRQVLSEFVTPLTSVVSEMLKSSDNFYADMLVRNLSAELSEQPATFDSGIAFVKLFLDQVGISRSEYSINSGSGFSHQNLISARAICKILTHLKNEKTVSPSFLSSLPIAGIDGTLKYRMRRTAAQGRVVAKTGYLRSLKTSSVRESGVVTLAGFATRPDGTVLTFVFLYNGRQNPNFVRALFDKICVGLIEPASSLAS